jgi:hypothetical protein
VDWRFAPPADPARAANVDDTTSMSAVIKD